MIFNPAPAVCICSHRSTSGIIPVRWTAPEGLTSQKFSAASDVWSFGIVCVEILQDGTTPYPQMKSNPEVMAFVNNAKVHPHPAGCTDQVYSELRRCFSFKPEARPSFAELNEFFVALVATYSSARFNMPSGGPRTVRSFEDQNQHILSLLHGHTDGNPTLFEELREDGDITIDETYNTSEYMQLGDKRKASVARENQIVGGLNGLQISTKLRQAVEALDLGALKYHEQFEKWRSNDRQNDSLVKLKGVVSTVKARFTAQNESHDQPNPWRKDGITTISKRFLTRMITVYNGTGAKYDVVVDPLADVVAACDRIVARFGVRVKLVPGPPKTEERIMEKARDGDGNYAAIRDVGRLSLIIEDILLMPDVVAALCGCQDFEVSRIKNRLDPDHTIGYRDVQLLVREPKGKWLVEVQVIPKEMYELKQTDGYTKYRFILEACKRAKAMAEIPTALKYREQLNKWRSSASQHNGSTHDMPQSPRFLNSTSTSTSTSSNPWQTQGSVGASSNSTVPEPISATANRVTSTTNPAYAHHTSAETSKGVDWHQNLLSDHTSAESSSGVDMFSGLPGAVPPATIAWL